MESPKDLTPTSTSVSNANLGVWFVKTFRWFMLFCLTLIISKGVESIAWGNEGYAQFRLESVVVFGPNFGWWPSLNFGMLNRSYIAGVMELFITLLFAIRYVPAFIDPIERYAELDGNEDIVKDKVISGLGRIKPVHIASVFVVATVEYLLLVHASMSFSQIRQWLNFLLALVVFDSMFFLSKGIIFFVLAKIYEPLRIGVLRFVIKIFSYKDQNASDNYIEQQISSYFKNKKELGQKLVSTYGLWNVIDFAVIVVFLQFIPSGGGGTQGIPWTVLGYLFLLLIAVAVTTYFHFKSPKPRAAYHRHIAVFSSLN